MAKQMDPTQRLATAARVQTATWGVLIIWVGILMASDFDNKNDGIGLTVLGAIFLVSGVLQRAMARREGTGFIVAGAVMMLLGINDLMDENLSVGAIAVVALGVLVLASAIKPPRARKTKKAATPPPPAES